MRERLLCLTDPLHVVVDDLAGYGRTEIGFTASDGLQREAQFEWSRVLDQVTRHPCAQRLQYVLFTRVHGQNDDLDPGMVLLEPKRCLETIHSRHGDVHQHDIWMVCGYERENLVTVVRFGDYRHLLELFHQRAQPRPHQGMVVCEDDAQRIHASAPPCDRGSSDAAVSGKHALTLVPSPGLESI